MSEPQKTFLGHYDELYREYLRIDPSYVMPEEKKAFWIQGTNRKALFLAHGYLGTPSEMMTIAQPFLKEGFSVIGFLIPGHGGNSRITNVFKKSMWQETIRKSLEWVQECHDEVHVCGFSTGGLLLHDYLRNARNHKIKSASLVSPYFIPRIKTIGDSLLEKILNNKSLEFIYALSRMPDLKVMMIDRSFYSRELPATTAREIKELGKKIFLAEKKEFQTPVLLFLSKGDWTVDIKASRNVIARDAVNAEYVFYDGKEPHHLMVPSVSKVAFDVQEKIYHFTRSAF